MIGDRTPSRAPYLRRPWTEGRIGGRTFKGGLFLIGGVLIYMLLLSETGWIRQWQLQRQRTSLLSEIDRLETESLQLGEEARRLREDPSHRERIAREEWGYKREDEQVYHLRHED